MKFNQVEFYVAEYYLSAIINGDYSGMDTEEEEQACIEFERNAIEQYGVGHWSYDSEYSEDFRECEISGMRANCIDLTWNYVANKRQS